MILTLHGGQSPENNGHKGHAYVSAPRYITLPTIDIQNSVVFAQKELVHRHDHSLSAVEFRYDNAGDRWRSKMVLVDRSDKRLLVMSASRGETAQAVYSLTLDAYLDILGIPIRRYTAEFEKPINASKEHYEGLVPEPARPKITPKGIPDIAKRAKETGMLLETRLEITQKTVWMEIFDILDYTRHGKKKE